MDNPSLTDSPLSIDISSKKGPISMYVSSDFLKSSDYLGEIIKTLESSDFTNERCIVCDEKVTVKEYVPCCSPACAREAYVISGHLETALKTPEFDPSQVNIVHSRDKAAEYTMNVMLAIVIHCSNVTIQKGVRRLLLLLSIESRRVPGSLFLKDVRNKLRPVIRNEGGFGRVYMAAYNGMDVALKQIQRVSLAGSANKYYPDLSGPEKMEWHFRYEALIWKTLKHERLMPLIGILTGDQVPFDHDRSDCMVSQWCHEGSAMSFLNVMINEDQAFRWGGYYQGFVYRWLLQVIEGLKHLHSQGISHGDLHSGNILVTTAHSGIDNHPNFDILLTDFGLSVVQEANSQQQGSLRAGLFRAPEQIDTKKYQVESERPTVKSDIFTFAVLCYELYTTQPPYYGRDLNFYGMGTAIRNLEPLDQRIVVEVQGEYRRVVVPDGLWEIITECWVRPEDRPTLDWIEDRLKSMQIALTIPSKQT